MQDQDILRLLEARRYGEAFTPLVDGFKAKVFRLAVSILHNETQAEDAAQEVFVKIWSALPTYHGGASLSTWIYAITRNTCLTELKRRSRHPTVSLQEPGMEDASGWIPALQSADPAPGAAMDVDVLLAALPEKQRQVLTLFYFEQKSYAEAALMLGLPLGTVKTLLFRAKKELLNSPLLRAVPPEAVRSPAQQTPTAVLAERGSVTRSPLPVGTNRSTASDSPSHGEAAAHRVALRDQCAEAPLPVAVAASGLSEPQNSTILIPR
jgi:RNA polymerase sigma-70 factor (ECF subfamily)